MFRSAETTIPNLMCELFEVIIHNILYKRGLYPKTIFIRTRAYGIPVYQSIHPEVNEYVTECLRAVNHHLISNTFKALELRINAEKEVLERYNIHVLHLKDEVDSTFYIDLEQVFRMFYLKMEASVDFLYCLPKIATFTLNAHVTNHSWLTFVEDPTYMNFPWVYEKLIDEKREILPIHTLDSNYLKLQMYIEKVTHCD